MGNSFLENFFQIGHRRVSIGVSLKIGDVFVNRSFGRKHGNLTVYLFMDREGCTGGKITAAAFAAEDAAAVSYCAVAVGTAHATV